MMRRNTIQVVFLFLITIMFISGCSIKTAYKQLDWVLAGLIEDYVSLSEAQEADVDQRIVSFLRWHQFTQLNTYADDLQQVQQYTTMGLDDASAEDIFKRFMRSWEAIKERVAPEMADMFLALNDEQQQQLFEALTEQNQEMLEEYQEYTQEERFERAGDKLIENFERWLGDLNEPQEEILRSWPPNFKPLHEDRMAFRIKWQAALKDLLQQSMPTEEKRNQLIELVRTPDAYQTEEHKQKLVYNSKQLKALILSFDQTLTQEQRGYLAGRLDYFIVNFQELAAEDSSQ